MSIWKNDLTIQDTIALIQSPKMLLPAIQRKYARSEEQITERFS